MAYQGLVTGFAPNDGNGDTLLLGAQKINANFEDIYQTLGDGTTLGIATLTQLKTTGVVTASSFSGDGSGLTNIISSSSNYASVAGVSTLAEGLTGVPSIDVRHISAVGVITAALFYGSFSGNAGGLAGSPDIQVTNLNTLGLSTFVGVGTFNSDLYVGGDLYVADDLVLDAISARETTLSERVTTLDLTVNRDVSVAGDVSVTGVSTLGNTTVGGATTELIVDGDVRILGILTIGSSSITFDGSNNSVNVGAGVTIEGSTGVIKATSMEVDHTSTSTLGVTSVTELRAENATVTGVVTATSFSGSLLTSDLDGTISNDQLAGNIDNTKLTNDNISFGGISLNLGQLDDTPAFNLVDAVNYPYTSLTGVTTEISADTTPALGGNLNLNSNNIEGTGNINITGGVTATGDLSAQDITGRDITGRGANLSGVITATDAVFSGNVSIGGTLTYEDVTNVDSIGIVTARNGVQVNTGGITVAAGGVNVSGVSTFQDDIGITGTVTATGFSGPLTGTATGLTGTPSITVDGVTANSVSVSGPTDLAQVSVTGVSTLGNIDVEGNDIKAQSINFKTPNGSETFLAFSQSSSVDVYYDNLLRLQTTASGVDITGGLVVDNLDVSGVTTSAQTVHTGISSFYDDVSFLFDDSTGKIFLGPNNELEIFHANATGNSVIKESGSGSLILAGDNVNIRNAANNKNAASFIADGSANLFYNNGKKFETTGIGASVLGTLETFGSAVIGSNLNVTGISTFGGAVSVSGNVTATAFIGALAGNVDGTASGLSGTPDITVGDIVASQLNVSGLTTATNKIEIRSTDSTPGRIDLFCEVNNAHYARIQAPGHGSFSGNIVATLPTKSGNLIVGDSVAIDNDINTTGIITASSFSGSGSNLTSLTGASAGSYGGGFAIPVITVDANGRITGISTAANAGAQGGGGGIANVVDDTAPQLGGNLDLNGNNITGNGNINFTGTLTATSIVKSGGTSSQFLKADGSVDSSTYNNYTNTDVDTHLNVSGASAGEILSWNGTDYAWVADQTGGGGGGGGIAGVDIQNNGSLVGTAITTINFSTDLTATVSGTTATVVSTASGGGGGGGGGVSQATVVALAIALG